MFFFVRTCNLNFELLLTHKKSRFFKVRDEKQALSLCSLFDSKALLLILQETSNHVYMVMEVKTKRPSTE